jgi:hypothetical protein
MEFFKRMQKGKGQKYRTQRILELWWEEKINILS